MFLKQSLEINSEVNVEEMEFRFLTNSLSHPLTLLHGFLTGSGDSKKDNLVFHVAGSDVIEMLGIIKWEYILHRLPSVKSLRVIFVGLQLTEEEDGECSDIGECQGCSEAGRTMKYEIRKKTYKVRS
jgi:splicing suppressor protein 51